jgi:hypothetical protein
MVEWLTGEAGGLEVCLSPNDKADKQDQLEGGRIARLILAGNTLTMPIKGEDDHKPVSYRMHDVCVADNSETIQRFRPRSPFITSNKDRFSPYFRYPPIISPSQPHSRTIRSCRLNITAATTTQSDVWWERKDGGVGEYDESCLDGDWRTEVSFYARW